MNTEVLPPEQSDHEDRTAADSNEEPKSLPDRHDPKKIVDDIDHSTKIPTTRYNSFISFRLCFVSIFFREKLLPSISHSVKGAIMFAVFTSIAMVIGILTIYYTSPKPPGMFFLYYIVDNERAEKSNTIVLFQPLEGF
jgi:hypothetical protein